MKNWLCATLFVVGFLASIGQASAKNWLTKIEEDVLTDGKTAVMFGQISPFQAAYFFCSTDGRLEVEFLEKGKFQSGLEIVPFKMVFKIDDGDKIWLDATASEHNSEFYAIGNKDAKSEILQIVRAIRSGRRRLSLGIAAEIISFKWSGTAQLSGSTDAAGRFLSACGLK